MVAITRTQRNKSNVALRTNFQNGISPPFRNGIELNLVSIKSVKFGYFENIKK